MSRCWAHSRASELFYLLRSRLGGTAVRTSAVVHVTDMPVYLHLFIRALPRRPTTL